MPSPAIATTRPSRLERSRTCSRLLVGQDLGLDLVDAEPPRDGLRGRPAVAGQHDDAQALGAAAPRSASGVVSLIGSATPTRPATLAVDGDEHHRLALAAQAPRPRAASGPRRYRLASRQRAVAERDARAVDRAATRPCR